MKNLINTMILPLVLCGDEHVHHVDGSGHGLGSARAAALGQDLDFAALSDADLLDLIESM